MYALKVFFKQKERQKSSQWLLQGLDFSVGEIFFWRRFIFQGKMIEI